MVHALVHLFLGPEQAPVAAVAPQLLRIVSFAMLPLAFMQVLTGALRGAGDTRWPLLFTFIGFLGVRIPLAYLLGYTWGWGVEAPGTPWSPTCWSAPPWSPTASAMAAGSARKCEGLRHAHTNPTRERGISMLPVRGTLQMPHNPPPRPNPCNKQPPFPLR